ncbi:MAG TPA: MarR family transcriptional regulator [Gemmatimonadales bacterium]|nr:MarR family transcriptional regulator [Gemmatimonadales bacterium]
MSILGRIEQRAFSGDADQTVISVMVAADHLEQQLGTVIAAHGITTDQYNVLRILRGVHPEGHPRHEIARRMIHRAPDVTRMLDRLVKRKLIIRARDPRDARLSVARISPGGLALLKRIDPEVEEVQRKATAVLSAAERKELARLCDRLVT